MSVCKSTFCCNSSAKHHNINPFLHRLFLDHDIFFLFLDKIEEIQGKISKVLNTFENMENGENIMKNALFSIIFSNT